MLMYDCMLKESYQLFCFCVIDRTNEVQQELHEFRECSEEIEKELESQLEQNEQQMKDLKQQNASLTFEIESLKVSCCFALQQTG